MAGAQAAYYAITSSHAIIFSGTNNTIIGTNIICSGTNNTVCGGISYRDILRNILRSGLFKAVVTKRMIKMYNNLANSFQIGCTLINDKIKPYLYDECPYYKANK